ncbi:hypothetical protein KI387_020230, partial [Taxus chinensis]
DGGDFEACSDDTSERRGTTAEKGSVREPWGNKTRPPPLSSASGGKREAHRRSNQLKTPVLA